MFTMREKQRQGKKRGEAASRSSFSRQGARDHRQIGGKVRKKNWMRQRDALVQRSQTRTNPLWGEKSLRPGKRSKKVHGGIHHTLC